MTGIVSIHDVMPSTLGRVRALLEWLGGMEVAPVTLLVVPGCDWSHGALEELRGWEASGCELAGHGWCHRVTPRTLRHRLHAALVSRDVAEHLALDADGITDLVGRCHRWFGNHGFRSPRLYVPPAWAMGPISRARVADLPFARYEYLGGVLEAATGTMARIPMVGFEADRWWRQAAVGAWNRWNVRRACRGDGLLRIGIHPRDRELLMAGALEAMMRRCTRFASYDPASPQDRGEVA